MNPNETHSNPSLTTTTPAAAATDPPATLVTVADIVARLREIRQLIPEFELLPLKQRQILIAASSVDPAFVAASINAAGASPVVETMLGSTQAQLRQEADDADHWTELEQELKSMLEGVTTGNRQRKYRVGKAALDTYAITRRLATRPEHAELLPHVASMKQLARARRANRKAKTPATPPSTTPSTVPSTVPSTSPATTPSTASSTGTTPKT